MKRLRPQKDHKRPQNQSFAVSVQFLEMPRILRTGLGLGPRLLRVKTDQLSTEKFEAIQILRSAYKNKVVSALKETTATAPRD